MTIDQKISTENPFSCPPVRQIIEAKNSREASGLTGCDMDNSVQEAVAISDISMVESQGMSLSETLHHTIHLALFCLGVTLLCSVPHVSPATPFTGMLLLIPAMTAGIAGLSQLVDMPRWLQRAGIIAIYAAILVSVVPAGAPFALTAVFAAVAATSFLAPTLTTLSKSTVVFAAVVFAGLVVTAAVA